MKKTRNCRIAFLILLVGILQLMGCIPPADFSSVSVTRTETSAVIKWETNNDDYTSAEIKLFLAEDYSLVDSKSVTGTADKTVQFTQLKGFTKYEYEISLKGLEEPASHSGKFQTTYASKSLTLNTRDSLTLVGNLFYLSSWTEKVPAIIMMHGLGMSNPPWNESQSMDALIRNGYACMTFLFRGHGVSAPAFPLELLTGEEAIKYVCSDVEAAINTLRNEPLVDVTSIGLMGGSLGAAAATEGNHFPEVKASVAFSTVRAPGTKTFADFFPDINASPLQTIYYITAENDISENHNLPEYARYYYNYTLDPRRLWIIEGSRLHGHMVPGHPGVIDSMTSWFAEHLPSSVNP